MSDTLMTLVTQYEDLSKKLIEMGGELDPQLENELAVLDSKVPQKVEGYAQLIERLERESEYFAYKAEQYTKASDALDNLRSRLKDRIKLAMTTLGVDELKGVDTRFKILKTKGSIVIDSTENLPTEFKATKITVSPDKDMIRAAIEGGREIPGVRLEPGFSLRTYVNKSR